MKNLCRCTFFCCAIQAKEYFQDMFHRVYLIIVQFRNGLQQPYLWDNWPIVHVAGNDDGSYLAMAGRQGLLLYDLQTKKFRVFGDVLQERQLHCVGIVWFGKIVVLCNYRKSTNWWVNYEINWPYMSNVCILPLNLQCWDISCCLCQGFWSFFRHWICNGEGQQLAFLLYTRDYVYVHCFVVSKASICTSFLRAEGL